MTRLIDWLNADATPDFIAAVVVLTPILAALIVAVATLNFLQTIN